MNTEEHTVEELIELWQEGELGIDEGTIDQQDGMTIQLSFEGSDGNLYTTYSIAEELSYRSDCEEGSNRFNILEDQ